MYVCMYVCVIVLVHYGELCVKVPVGHCQVSSETTFTRNSGWYQ